MDTKWTLCNNYYRKEAGRCGIPCIWWDCGAYALLDRESKTWKFPELVEALTNEAVN